MTPLQRAIVAAGAAVGLALVAKADDADAKKRRAPGSSDWRPPPGATPYRDAARIAEIKYGIPETLLLALLDQESGFRPEVIHGGQANHAGAVGIAQIIPRWHPDVDPSKPFEAIDYAGRYLRENFDRFGNWDHALAAYNWGPTALATHGYDRRPRETREYVERINARVFA